MVACIDGHDSPLGVMRRRVAEYTGGQWTEQPGNTYTQNIFSYYISVSCNHCVSPVCVAGCPTTAMHKDAQGIVSVDHGKCVGCRYCEWNCPYSAPQFDAALGKMIKCDACSDRLAVGRQPLCVEACPMRALHFGDYEDLKQRFGDAAHVAPLVDQALTRPAFVVTPAHNAVPVGSPLGAVRNPEEM